MNYPHIFQTELPHLHSNPAVNRVPKTQGNHPLLCQTRFGEDEYQLIVDAMRLVRSDFFHATREKCVAFLREMDDYELICQVKNYKLQGKLADARIAGYPPAFGFGFSTWKRPVLRTWAWIRRSFKLADRTMLKHALAQRAHRILSGPMMLIINYKSWFVFDSEAHHRARFVTEPWNFCANQWQKPCKNPNFGFVRTWWTLRKFRNSLRSWKAGCHWPGQKPKLNTTSKDLQFVMWRQALSFFCALKNCWFCVVWQFDFWVILARSKTHIVRSAGWESEDPGVLAVHNVARRQAPKAGIFGAEKPTDCYSNTTREVMARDIMSKLPQRHVVDLLFFFFFFQAIDICIYIHQIMYVLYLVLTVIIEGILELRQSDLDHREAPLT